MFFKKSLSLLAAVAFLSFSISTLQAQEAKQAPETEKDLPSCSEVTYDPVLDIDEVVRIRIRNNGWSFKSNISEKISKAMNNYGHMTIINAERAYGIDGESEFIDIFLAQTKPCIDNSKGKSS